MLIINATYYNMMIMIVLGILSTYFKKITKATICTTTILVFKKKITLVSNYFKMYSLKLKQT